MLLEKIIESMKEIFKDIPYGIEHSLKVLKDSELIMSSENITEANKQMVRVVAVLHDIGAVEAQRKYGSMASVYQEMEGPAIARHILDDEGCSSSFIERACYIIGHHHTFSKIDKIDFQIIWEADQLAALEYMDIKEDDEKVKLFINENFKTKTGKTLAINRFAK